MGVAILPSGGPEEARIPVGRPPTSRPPSHRSYSRHSERTGRPDCFYSCGLFEDMSDPRDMDWTPEPSTAKSLCASTVAFRPGSDISESISTPNLSVDVSTWNNSNTPLSSSDIRLKLDNPIDLTGHILSPFFIREFVYQGCHFHSIAHLMCYRYAVLQGLNKFANSIRKWVKHLTDSPPPPPASRHLNGRGSVDPC